MAEAAVSVAIDLLASLIASKVELLSGIREEVAEMRRTLESIRAFLKDAERSNELRDQDGVKAWVKDAREVAYDIENIVDEFLLRFGQSRGLGLKGLLRRYRLANKIQIIKDRLQRISERRNQFSFQVAQAGVEGSNYVDGPRDPRLTQPLFIEESEVVGIEMKRQELIALLLDGGMKPAVVSVVGMGGLGKTTLVSKVYHNTRVGKEFTSFAWITVSQSFSPQEILKSLVKEIMGNDHTDMDYCQLVQAARSFLQDKRFLIVFDDLWTVGAWEDYLKWAFPENELKSRIIVTTRVHRVALHCSKTIELVYKLKSLQEDEAWILFCRKTFNGLACPPELEQPSKKILAMCGGLPLAIVAIGGLLLTENKSHYAWNSILNNIAGPLQINSDVYSRIDRILSLSYESLPYHLKPCLMYFCMFPQDKIIYKDQLFSMWIAEGFVKEEQGMSLEDTAGGYLNELVNRSLVEAASLDFEGMLSSCKVHDIIHELISSKCREQNFITLAKEIDQAGMKDHTVRRITIYDTDGGFLKNTSYKDARSLLIFAGSNVPNFARFKMLKVLSLSYIKLGDFPDGVVNLFHLRYLNLRGTGIKDIPNSIGKLKNLQTLDLINTLVSELPIGILKCCHLRAIICFFNFSDPGFCLPARLGGLTSLVKLMNCKLDGTKEQARELGKLTRMRELGISTARGQDWIILRESLTSMRQLVFLRLNTADEDVPLDVSFMPGLSPSLRNIILVGSLQISPQMFDSFENLARIMLIHSRLRDDPLQALGHLPFLAQLILVDAYDGE